jgi:TonB family protein
MGTQRLQRALVISLMAFAPPILFAQSSNPPAATTSADPALDAATTQIGRALILRCFCGGDNLRFDAQGHPLDAVHTEDWTLAGVNVLKVERHPATPTEPAQIELDGVRVAIRYASDRHEFDRHAQNTEHIKILIADPDPAAFAQALTAVFSEGIDRQLQLSMPPLWQHYFEPSAAWPADALSGQTVFTSGAKVAADKPGDPDLTVIAPIVSHKAEADSTTAAMRDHVQGTVILRMAVDAEGQPHRITIVQPLGYGLDAQAATAAAKMRFTPGTLGGKPIAAYVLIREDFVLVAPPGI